MTNTNDTLRPKAVHQQTVTNLRQQYGAHVAHLSDVDLYYAFLDWDMSDKSETFLDWIGD